MSSLLSVWKICFCGKISKDLPVAISSGHFQALLLTGLWFPASNRTSSAFLPGDWQYPMGPKIPSAEPLHWHFKTMPGNSWHLNFDCLATKQLVLSPVNRTKRVTCKCRGLPVCNSGSHFLGPTASWSQHISLWEQRTDRVFAVSRFIG